MTNSSISRFRSKRNGGGGWSRAAFIAGFILVMLVGDRVGAYGLGLLVQKSQFRISKLYSGTISADIVVFGNSYGMYSMYPTTLSDAVCRPVFNASYFSLSPAVVDALFGDFVERNPAPKYAMFEISNTSLGDWSIFQLSPFFRRSSNLVAVNSAMDKAFPYWSRLTNLHYYDSELLGVALKYLSHTDQGWTKEVHVSPAAIQSYAVKNQIEYEDPKPDEKIRHYRNVIANAQRHGIQVIFFVAPHHPIFYMLHPNAGTWIKTFQDAMGAGVPIIDFSHTLSDDALFSDVDHLNRSGSVELIKYLMTTDVGRHLSACP